MREEADWGEVFTLLISHTNMTYDEIGNRTIPQLEAVLGRIGRHISLKLGIVDSPAKPPPGKAVPGKPPKTSTLRDLFSAFGGKR